MHGAGILTQAFNDRGASALLLDGVDTDAVWAALDAGRVDHIFAPPTVLAKILSAAGDRRVAGVRTIFCGTAPLLPGLYARARSVFGPVIRVTYGKSEITNPIATLSPAETDAYYAGNPIAEGDGVCVGFPGTGVEIEARDEAGVPPCRQAASEKSICAAATCPRGIIDASLVFVPLPADGFHATGDYGRIDSRGRLHLVGRVADVIKSGGYKIHPDEIERCPVRQRRHAVAVAIVSLPSDYWGEIIVAVAETDDPGMAGPGAGRVCLGELARYKHPRAFLTRAGAATQRPGQDPAARDPRDRAERITPIEDGAVSEASCRG